MSTWLLIFIAYFGLNIWITEYLYRQLQEWRFLLYFLPFFGVPMAIFAVGAVFLVWIEGMIYKKSHGK